MANVDRLRQHLHHAIDAAFEAFFQASAAGAAIQEGELILEDADAGPFIYKWPSENDIEKYHRSALFRPNNRADFRIRLGWTRSRNAWKRKRERAIAFLEKEPERRYPLTEFVETDDGAFAAYIRDPKNPKRALRDTIALPERFSEAVVKRTDELFRGVKSAPSVRLVLPRNDEMGMANHGLWVGRLRGKIPR